MNWNVTITVVIAVTVTACSSNDQHALLDREKLATAYFQEDAEWYRANIPFFECSDKEIEQVYYYRWKMYKAHIRKVGDDRFVITEFINDMHWDRDPFSTINAATMHHIYEGRWLNDSRVMDGYIDNMFQYGGNNRHYSESVADAAYARYLVNMDSAFLLRQLDSMKQSYNGWSDHFDPHRNLYFIPAMPDATEYTIASIDASGGKDGFAGGEAYRPTINSYMYGNAMAIARIAAMKKDGATSSAYLRKAAALKSSLLRSLWNDSLQHFTDRYQVSNQYVHAWDFIRGRELAGMAPWYFNIPDNTDRYSAAWKHVTDTSELLGRYGLRTNEPSYPYYFKQFTFSFGKPGSQWNGPSWPYQTSQVLTGMANLLNNYTQRMVSPTDYLTLLRQYTRQHFLPDGRIDLVENYDPNKGGPIVHFYWSNHYNHSTYNNLIITGLCGIRPSASDTLTVHPLIDNSLTWFCLDNVRYHGHSITVCYDLDGTRYHIGKGLTVFVDGKKSEVVQHGGDYKVAVGGPVIARTPHELPNRALNILKKGFPIPSASINTNPDTTVFQAIDGRIWYFKEVSNKWSSLGSASFSDWFAVDFGELREISVAKIYLYAAGDFGVPESLSIDYRRGDQWLPVAIESRRPLVGNTANTFRFKKIAAEGLRINFVHKTKAVGLTELECY